MILIYFFISILTNIFLLKILKIKTNIFSSLFGVQLILLGIFIINIYEKYIFESLIYSKFILFFCIYIVISGVMLGLNNFIKNK